VLGKSSENEGVCSLSKKKVGFFDSKRMRKMSDAEGCVLTASVFCFLTRGDLSEEAEAWGVEGALSLVSDLVPLAGVGFDLEGEGSACALSGAGAFDFGGDFGTWRRQCWTSVWQIDVISLGSLGR